tara:strand:- start:383 stop:3430 length:3048 start_codon:yes stop_codon:yes gene_type:complete
MSGDAHCLLNQKQFDRTTKETLGPKEKLDIHNKMIKLYEHFEKGIGFENIKKSGRNNYETFEKIFQKSTQRLELDPSQFPIDYKMFRKFEAGLQHFNDRVAKKRGWFAKNFFISKAALRGIPELASFEQELSAETSFFRSYTNSTGNKVNDILSLLNEFNADMGRDNLLSVATGALSKSKLKKVGKIEQEYSEIFKQLALSEPGSANNKALQIRMDNNRKLFRKYLETDAGESLKIFNKVLEGADPESFDGLSNPQKKRLNKIQKTYSSIRKETATSLIRGLQRIRKMAKDKDLKYGDSLIDRLSGLVKAIEFQQHSDTSGKLFEHKMLADSGTFIELGFKLDGKYLNDKGEVAFTPHYKSQYSLELLKTIRKVEDVINEGKMDIEDVVMKEVNDWDSIVNVAKTRNPIVNDLYSIDPYFFLRKYTSDVGLFNYKTHIKSTFTKAVRTLTEEHLKVAERFGDKNIVDSSKDMLVLLNDIRNDISYMDPTKDQTIDNLSRILTGFTYFRLMGGNVRSAARNATQRFYEFVEFGIAGSRQSKRFYTTHGDQKKNNERVIRQSNKFGLQWGADVSFLDKLLGRHKTLNLSEQSRGALEDAQLMEKDLFIDKNGELTIKSSDAYSLESMTATGAQAVSGMAQKFGALHRMVEDWNRGGTFKKAFALAHENLSGLNKDFLARKILTKSQQETIMNAKGENHVIGYKDLHFFYKDKTAKKIEDYVENTAGQVAYNATQDLHFEYAKWNKAQALRAKAGGNTALNFIKTGLGQFSHYRFEMARKMWNWGGDAITDLKASRSYGDLRSEPALKAIRFGMLQAMIVGTTIATRTNFIKLMPNDVQESADAFWTWMTAKRETLADGEVSKETQDKLNRKTYGQGGVYFLGPNVDMMLSITELFLHGVGLQEIAKQSNPVINQMFNRSTEQVFQKTKNKEALETYQDWQWFNSQLARTIAYTGPVFSKSGLSDAALLELGLFPSKEQREASRRLYGIKKKSRKKLFKKSQTTTEKMQVLRALEGLR